MRKILFSLSLVFLLGLTSCSSISSGINQKRITAKVSSTFVKPSNGGTTYIVNLKQDYMEPEPFLVENTLTSYDQTERFSKFQELEKSNECLDVSVYGTRIPMFTYRGISGYSVVSCK
jgi:hypothetical protein